MTAMTSETTDLFYLAAAVLFVPLLLSFSYYVFEYSLLRKMAGTAVIVFGIAIWHAHRLIRRA